MLKISKRIIYGFHGDAGYCHDLCLIVFKIKNDNEIKFYFQAENYQKKEKKD